MLLFSFALPKEKKKKKISHVIRVDPPKSAVMVIKIYRKREREREREREEERHEERKHEMERWKFEKKKKEE